MVPQFSTVHFFPFLAHMRPFSVIFWVLEVWHFVTFLPKYAPGSGKEWEKVTSLNPQLFKIQHMLGLSSFFGSTFFYMCFATRPRASLTAVFKHPDSGFLSLFNATMFHNDANVGQCFVINIWSGDVCLANTFLLCRLAHTACHTWSRYMFGSPGNHKKIDWHQNLGFSSDTFAF